MWMMPCFTGTLSTCVFSLWGDPTDSLSKKKLFNRLGHGHLLHPRSLRRANGSSRALSFSPELQAAAPALLWFLVAKDMDPCVKSREYIDPEDLPCSAKPLATFSYFLETQQETQAGNHPRLFVHLPPFLEKSLGCWKGSWFLKPGRSRFDFLDLPSPCSCSHFTNDCWRRIPETVSFKKIYFILIPGCSQTMFYSIRVYDIVIWLFHTSPGARDNKYAP